MSTSFHNWITKLEGRNETGIHPIKQLYQKNTANFFPSNSASAFEGNEDPV